MSNKGVNIIGIGAVSSCGAGVKTLVEHIREGLDSTSLVSISPSIPERFKISFIPGREEAVKRAKTAEEFIDAVILKAVNEAMMQAGLDTESLKDCAFIIGSSGFILEAEIEYRIKKQKGENMPAPLARRGAGHIASRLARRLGINGPVITITTACTSSANAMLAAGGMIERGDIKKAIVVGAEFISVVTLNGFNSLMLLDPCGCKPFDADRRGIQMGEACAAIIMEKKEKTSKDRYSLCGWANLCDTHNVVSSRLNGASAHDVMLKAIKHVGIEPRDVTAIKTHGTASPDNDLAETRGMRTLFDSAIPPFTALKGYVGNTLGACGAIETAAFIGCLDAGFIPRTFGFSEIDPAIGIAPLEAHLDANKGYYLLNFFGFGGNNTSLVLRYG
ncbi:MAG: beta-ketoacyl synthase N-terminal-like domain-containing protein [Deltaproteobacteria bacterium]|nr:beta-ketoacyl synthase N-terminal-like domain-containing protein [Deltaproteobacteria bacterium]